MTVKLLFSGRKQADLAPDNETRRQEDVVPSHARPRCHGAAKAGQAAAAARAAGRRRKAAHQGPAAVLF